MTVQEEINKLKTEKNAIILAHNYEPPEIQDIADFIGDSLELALRATDVTEDIIVFCGVLFMAETAKILNPEKKVILPAPDAGCLLADQLSPEMIKSAREDNPGAEVVLYVNSTAESKAYADIVCTSANAVDVVKSLKSETVLFGPDSNLASYVQEQLPDKKIVPLPKGGNCPVHVEFTPEDAISAKKKGYTVICHPECPAEVRAHCDIIASTGSMMRNTHLSERWAVMTEKDMAYRLKTEYPDKEFLSFEKAVCKDMKKISLNDVLSSLNSESPEINLPADLMDKAESSIRRMIDLSRKSNDKTSETS
ncbi:quinolinate synthase NadA [Methanoplanus endosymbiosus]|uniref:Quinolinate synthase n=1 Tax=Methanoplanus endosymbiosus TaxID=33865 RepID=A0A9E7PMR0_9EURY|nr:quinolinate synthase NadA [Methanoplanus endosymbiosus]UUX91506.1 quinolinate synthase NadA [Methanoplanus endosymbiosus]